MKWTKLALTTMTLASFTALCFTACDQPPEEELGSLTEIAMRAIDVDVFELDGNAVNADNTLGEDWDDVYNDDDTATESSFVEEPTETSNFIGGGSKDGRDISAWKWTSKSTPDKNDLLNAYAALYGDVLYFGADRFATDGAANIGFWFFQDSVVRNPNGTFSGEHRDGDILVVVGFEQGGAVPVVRVWQWDGETDTLVLISDEDEALCGPEGLAQCAITNSESATAPWPYVPKGATGNSDFPPQGFFEGAIDLAMFNGADLCFASFLAETRSSTEVSAVLKDFVLGDFQECVAAVTLEPDCSDVLLESTNSCVGFEVTFTAKVCNNSTGVGDRTLTITSLTGPPGTVFTPTPTTVPASTCVTFTGTYHTTTIPGSPTDPVDPTSVEFTGDVTLEGTVGGVAITPQTLPFKNACPLCPACGG